MGTIKTESAQPAGPRLRSREGPCGREKVWLSKALLFQGSISITGKAVRNGDSQVSGTLTKSEPAFDEICTDLDTSEV